MFKQTRQSWTHIYIRWILEFYQLICFTRAYDHFNHETGAFCRQESNFEANNTYVMNGGNHTCGDLPDFLKNNLTGVHDIASYIAQTQSQCCEGESSNYSADTNNLFERLHKLGTPIISLLGWMVFLVALWIKNVRCRYFRKNRI